MQEPKKKDPVIVAGKDTAEVDNTYFLLPVKILDHDGPLGTSFPVENRHLPQGRLLAAELQLLITTFHCSVACLCWCLPGPA